MCSRRDIIGAPTGGIIISWCWSRILLDFHDVIPQIAGSISGLLVPIWEVKIDNAGLIQLLLIP